jgi:hypothetical protein
MSEDNLEKIYVDLPNHWAVGGESMWAKPLGNNLCQIDNIPFYAYGINYRDIVKVDSSNETKKPLVLEVVEPSGYNTLRIVFDKKFDKAQQNKLFEALKDYKADVERASEQYVALSVAPNGDYDAVYDKLTKLEQNGLLEFETCEAKNSNNFDVAGE